ncbi:hypothetical protein MM817_00777 [Acidibacillus sp. S0AB]|uniref:Uncharacterized protein n=1 Tax=Sulfoacidibacillus ferrooxidans TaxID=2005001 RepID=A0A9X2ADN6_9BACL|nr:hypothetical protein [Sulfoacidibacillus ferrooxidans]
MWMDSSVRVERTVLLVMAKVLMEEKVAQRILDIRQEENAEAFDIRISAAPG